MNKAAIHRERAPNRRKTGTMLACEALSRNVIRVDGKEYPAHIRESCSLYAVFSGNIFQGLVNDRDIAHFPHRAFADIVSPVATATAHDNDPIEYVMKKMSSEGLEAIAVMDSKGKFIGALTLMSILDKILKRESTLIKKTIGLQKAFNTEKGNKSQPTVEFLNASKALFDILSHSTLETNLLQGAIGALARLINAQYGAIAVTGENGNISQFVFHGISAADAAKIGHFPRGKGLLGTIIDKNAVLHLDDLANYPGSTGFPPEHPPMKSLLAVPISNSGAKVFGRIYLCDKSDGCPFSDEDMALTASFAQSLSLIFEHADEISELRKTQNKLMHMAYYDTLTGLPNRILLFDRLEQTLSNAKRNRTQSALMFLDLDDFKDINDSAGHKMGDEVLKEIGRIISRCIRGNDTASRIGGDEFVVILPEIQTNRDAVVVAQKILDAFLQPICLGNHEFKVSISIGIATFPADGTNAELLMKNADTAMYRAKTTGKNNYTLFRE